MQIHMLPAEDGDCILIEIGSQPYRILIDGGRKRSAEDRVWHILKSLSPVKTPMIDLLVLTHVDGDHIEGLLWLVKQQQFTVGEVWFNGLEHCEIAAGTRKALPALAEEPEEVDATLSIAQGIDFTNALLSRQWKWNERLPGNVAALDPEGLLNEVPLVDGWKITLVGPTKNKLARFAKKWAKEMENIIKEAGAATLRGKNVLVETPSERDVRWLATQRDTPDKALPNATSIAFVLESPNQKVLFCGDAHPDDLVEGIRLYGGGNLPVEFDAIKASHHGSAANNTSEFLTSVKTANWLISTNGSRHKHPDSEAISRIVSKTESKTLHFNYNAATTRLWESARLGTHFDYKCTFGEDGYLQVKLDEE